MLRKVVSGSMVLAAVPVASAAQKSGGEATLKRPTELPIYNAVEERFDHFQSYSIQMANNNNLFVRIVQQNE